MPPEAETYLRGQAMEPTHGIILITKAHVRLQAHIGIFSNCILLSVAQLNPAGTSKAEIEVAMAGKILDQVEIMGTYAR